MPKQSKSTAANTNRLMLWRNTQKKENINLYEGSSPIEELDNTQRLNLIRELFACLSKEEKINILYELNNHDNCASALVQNIIDTEGYLNNSTKHALEKIKQKDTSDLMLDYEDRNMRAKSLMPNLFAEISRVLTSNTTKKMEKSMENAKARSGLAVLENQDDIISREAELVYRKKKIEDDTTNILEMMMYIRSGGTIIPSIVLRIGVQLYLSNATEYVIDMIHSYGLCCSYQTAKIL